MRWTTKLLLASFAAAALVVFHLPQPISSQGLGDELGLAIKPAILEISAEPGTTVSTEISIQNISSGPIGVEVGARSLIPNDPEIDQSKRKDYDASTWFLAEDPSLLLDNDEIQTVPVQFLVPPDAGPGSHYTLITFKTLGAGDLNLSTAQVSPELTSIALITVAGDIVESAEIMPLDVPLFTFGDSHHVEFNIANNGNVHLLPTATVNLYDRSDELVETKYIQPQLILPNTIKSYKVDWESGGRVGLHRLEVVVSYGTPSEVITLNSGALVLMPSWGTLIYWSIAVLILIYVLVRYARGFLIKAWALTGRLRYRFGNKRRRLQPMKNQPEDLAELSFSAHEIDDILSQPRRPGHGRVRPAKPTIHTSARPKPKPKKIKIR